MLLDLLGLLLGRVPHRRGGRRDGSGHLATKGRGEQRRGRQGRGPGGKTCGKYGENIGKTHGNDQNRGISTDLYVIYASEMMKPWDWTDLTIKDGERSWL